MAAWSTPAPSQIPLPALRLGFLIAPPSLRNSLRAASQIAGWYTNGPPQSRPRHPHRRRPPRPRHALILHNLVVDFSDWLRSIPAVTGIHIAATLRSRSRTHERDLAALAAPNDVAFDRLSGYWPSGRAQPGIVLGYGGIATAKIAEGLSRLRRCFERLGGNGRA